jgi:hypothetical protein
MKIIKTFCFIIFSAFLVNAQTPDETKKELTEITVARSGWTDPIFATDIELSRDEYLNLTEDVVVNRRRSTFSKAKNISFESCNSQNDKKDSKENQRSYIVSDFLTYEVSGRVFAYEFYGIIPRLPLLPTLPGENPVGYSGCISSFNYLYVDEDGDGNFELRCKRMDIMPLPQWVKDLGEIKVKTK